MAITTTCIKCGIAKGCNAFVRDTSRSNGLHPWCRGCKRAYDIDRRVRDGARLRAQQAARHKANPGPARIRASMWYEKHRDTPRLRVSARSRRLMAKFGITLAEFEEMLRQQGGTCYVCPSTKTLCVDHDHRTGQIRAILCQRCNVALGLIESNLVAARKLIAYAEKAWPVRALIVVDRYGAQDVRPEMAVSF